MTSRHQPSVYLLFCFLLALGFAANRPRLFAQPGTQGPQNYSTRMTTQRLYYDPPNQDKVKMELSGETITNSDAGALITGAKMRSYSVAGGPPQLTAETASCVFDVSTFKISSTNLLQARTGDDNFYVEGVGFLWQKATPDLTLSNRVHTIIRQFDAGNLAPAKTNSPGSKTDLYAEDATFDTKTGLIVYRDGVRVIGPQLTLTCAILTAQ
ncbi:MAG TPA: hypothetical protein VK731_13705 [Candidatus Cybelea sp.]|nr:hypothetical protein [Candidatus Cybelea sp.]